MKMIKKLYDKIVLILVLMEDTLRAIFEYLVVVLKGS